jgi:hypothetical protein
VLTNHETKRNGLKAALAACRIERQRLASKSAALPLRAATAEDALARNRGGHLMPLNGTDDRPEASYVVKQAIGVTQTEDQ